jgi:iron complex outermembrane receptor protein
LTELSIEELVNVEISSVAKKPTLLYEAPAAVAVLTQEDIRRLGATSLPEALRAVPGLAVARLNANKWAVSSRGFADEYANELLVLVDGRSVYTPSFGGVYWNVQDLVLEDLDRIEVIRGPGATLWGANAVNGVINLITKSAKETQGVLLSSSFGTEDQPSISARYGGQLASNLFYRVFAKYFNRDGFSDAHGLEMEDDWRVTRGGLRLDWEPSEANTFTLLGDYYDGTYGEPVSRAALFPPTNVLLRVEAPMSGAYALGRWQRRFSEESELKLQVYFDQYERNHPFGGAMLVAGPDLAETERLPGETRDTWDLDLQHRFALSRRQDVIWGVGYRYSEDHYVPNGCEVRLVPDRRGDQLFNVFLQDEITVVGDRLRLTLGSKFERNDYTGLEVQPGARLLWTPTERHSIWTSVARAVRTPTHFERGVEGNLTAIPPAMIRLYSNPELTSEKLLAYEIGYRVEPTSRLSFDLAAFYNDYQDLIVSDPGPPRLQFTTSPYLVVPFTYVNRPPGHTYGAEVLAQWLATDHWRLTGGYSWLHTALAEGNTLSTGDDFPQQQFHLRSSLDLSHGWELDAALYCTDQISVLSADFVHSTSIPAYARLDVGLHWRPNKRLELAVWGQNLFDNGHPEYGSYKTSAVVEIPRTVYGKVTWRF